MPRVIGIDLGTVSIDLCGLDDGRVFLDQSVATAEALAHPSALVQLLDDAHRAAPVSPRGRLAWEAYLESAVKAVAALAVSVPHAHEVILSGRMARVAGVHDELARWLAGVVANASVHVLTGLATVAKQAAQSAALLADGLAGGRAAPLVDAMGIRDASGTALDHLYMISQATARARLGIA